MKKTVTFLTFLGSMLIFAFSGNAVTPLKPLAYKSAVCEAQWEKLPKVGGKGIYFGGRGIVAREIPLSKEDFIKNCKEDFQNLY